MNTNSAKDKKKYSTMVSTDEKNEAKHRHTLLSHNNAI